MIRRYKKSIGFTLIEVLVSITIIAIVAIASYTGFYVLSAGNEASTNRLRAISLSQAALEEIRGVARSDFVGLTTHYAGHINQPTQTPGFLRTINIFPVSGTASLQRAEVTISWQDRGQPKSYNTAILISQPPQPLPANIYGDVLDASTGSMIVGARVYLTHNTTSHTLTTTTATNINCPLHPQHNPRSYHFCDTAGNFKLETGDWNLQVKCEAPGCTAYYDSITIPIFPPPLSSNEDRRVADIWLQPRPTNGNITGRFVAAGTSTAITGLAVSLRKNGVEQQTITNNPDGFKFLNIAFTNSNPQCFTVHTGYAYLKRYCGNFCGPTKPCIDDADPETPALLFNYHGWSSSGITCGNPWIGNASTDTICINPGETRSLGDIQLSYVPLATLQGQITNTNGSAVSGAVIETWWHDGTTTAAAWYGTTAAWWGSATTDSSGNYGSSSSFQVPAEQSLFPDNTSYYLKVRARAYVPRTCCCNISCAENVMSPQVSIGPLYQGVPFTWNYALPAAGTNQQCGNADGYLKNGQNNTALAGVTVAISGSKTTDSNGYYLFQCPGTGHRIPRGFYNITANKGGYYTFESWGNKEYSNRGKIEIKEGLKTTYETIRLWPKGFGSIQGQVLHQGTTNPVIGATVQLDYYSDGGDTTFERTATTDSSGGFAFTNVVETWPVPAVVENPYYNQTNRRHYLKFSHPDYYETSRSNQTLNANQVWNSTIEMTPKEGI